MNREFAVAHRQWTTVSIKVVVSFIILGVLWVAATSPLIWRSPHLWWVTAFRGLSIVVAGGVLYFTLRRERTLAESRKDYEQLFRTFLEPVLIHQDGYVVRANDHALTFFEAGHESDLMGKPVLSLVHPEYQSVAVNRVRSLEEGKATQRIEEKFITLRGNVRDVEIAGVPIRFRGRPATMILFRDITARIQQQIALHDSQSRLRTVIDALPDQIVLLDSQERWVEANRILLQSLGLTDANYRGRTSAELADLCDPMFRTDMLTNSQYAPGTFETVTQFSHESIQKDGSVQYHEVLRVPVKEENGNNRGLVVIARDRTEQRLTTKRILESEQRYRSLFEHDGDMIVSVDVKGVILSANPSAVSTLGYSMDELIGRYYRDFVAPEDVAASYAHFIGVLKGVPQRTEMTLVHKNGHLVPVDEKKIPIIVEDGVTGFFCIVRDMTEQNAAEELLIRSERMSAVGQMAAGIVHEIRNPLTVLKGFVQLMQSTPASKELYLSIMNAEFERIESILTELLVFAKPTARKLEHVSCRDLIQDVVNLMTSEALLRNIEFCISLCKGRLAIYCDKQGVKQVLVNVIKNAIEAMPEGGTIDLCLRPKDIDSISILVRDRGTGIPEDQLNRVGEPFFTTKEKGTGLGLMVCRKIVEAHQGEFQIRSTVGLGTEVEILLPNVAVGED